MKLREEAEKREETYLSPLATYSIRTRGRAREESPCEVRTSFQRDRDRIIHSKAFRRLKHKTQVFIAPEGDHYRTRLTHTLEVSQIARTAARALCLNEDLTEAIALGHDLGHTPFGHAGEEALEELMPGGFRHNEQSLRVVDRIEQKSENYRGLNLCWEVRDGIRGHTGEEKPSTPEGQVVRIADRVAYINHDIDDACRAGILTLGELPGCARRVLGYTHGERIDSMVSDIIAASREGKSIRMSPRVFQVTTRLREFMFEQVYVDSMAKKEEQKAERLLKMLYEYYRENPAEILSESSLHLDSGDDSSRLACDYVAGMTDRYAIMKFDKLFMPHPWSWY